MEIIASGDIFNSRAQTIVNTVNCNGVMGKGIALQFKKRYPKMFFRYKTLCREKQLDIGKLWLYKSHHHWILNFPTKYDWRLPTEVSYLEAGLEKFVETYRDKGITSIAFPLLGASNGGLDPELSLEVMKRYLSQCNIPVYIYIKYQPETATLL